MLKKADVTVENMAPGTIERLGLGYDEVKKINPGIIFCQIHGVRHREQVREGPRLRHDRPSAGGLISVTGEPDRPPVKPGPSFGDTGTGMLMAVTIVGALYERQQTGQGRRLQVAMQDAMLHYMRTCFATQARTGSGNRAAAGNPPPAPIPPSGLYQCKPLGSNDWVYITTSRGNPDHWGRLMRLIGREELIDDPRFATGAARGGAGGRGRCDHHRVDAPAHQGRGDGAGQRCRGAGRCGLRHDGAAAGSDLRRARHHAGDCSHPTGTLKMPTWPVRVDGVPPRLKPSPLLGQHSAEVLGEWLGLDAGDIAALKREGVL